MSNAEHPDLYPEAAPRRVAYVGSNLKKTHHGQPTNSKPTFIVLEGGTRIRLGSTEAILDSVSLQHFNRSA